uniref:Uncharacterized protein n=1 Tax=Anguilla anguilla TaxID=7936 RepID=A0A0E9VI08_ANGAN
MKLQTILLLLLSGIYYSPQQQPCHPNYTWQQKARAINSVKPLQHESQP